MKLKQRFLCLFLGHVPKNDRSGPLSPYRGGECPGSNNQTPLHAVERRDVFLHTSRFQN